MGAFEFGWIGIGIVFIIAFLGTISNLLTEILIELRKKG